MATSFTKFHIGFNFKDLGDSSTFQNQTALHFNYKLRLWVTDDNLLVFKGSDGDSKIQ